MDLTPRYEGILGSNCTGTDGTANRTYVLTNANYYSVIEFLKQGAAMHETIDYTISGNTVTFIVIVFDSDVIGLRYFTSSGSAVVSAGYGYVSTGDVYRASGITSTEISTADVSNHILIAENIICRLTKTIYWRIVFDKQLATSGAAGTITKTGAGWTVNDLTDLYVWVYSGTGSTQIRKIVSNTADTITVDRNWTTTNPNNTSYFKIFYVPADFNPYVDAVYDGNGLTYMYLPNYPVKKVETLAIGKTPVTVTPSSLYLWEKTGKIQTMTTAEATYFSGIYPQEIDITYWYGVDHLPNDIKRLVELHTAFQILGQQMGGTFDDPGSIGLPEVNISVGQAYINIRSSLETIKEEYTELLKTVKIWPTFA
jgi:hypothetical protein